MNKGDYSRESATAETTEIATGMFGFQAPLGAYVRGGWNLATKLKGTSQSHLLVGGFR